MRIVPESILEALSGSESDATLICNAVYDGEVVGPDLAISSWSLSWRGGEQQSVQGSASFTVEDSNGELAPWGYAEPLSVGGSRVQAFFSCAGETVPLGEWVNSSNKPNEAWRLDRDGLTWISGGATIPLECADLTQLLDDDTFMAPEAPVPGATAISEIERLCDDVIVVEFNGVEDKAIPTNMVYENRLSAVSDLARLVGDYRVTGDGILEIYNPARPETPHWTVEPGKNGTVISVVRQQDRANLYNAVVATGQTEDGEELRAYATQDFGDLRFDGPFGRKPYEHSSMGTSQIQLEADAKQTLADRVDAATTEVSVDCAPSPLYELGDWGIVVQPIIDGTAQPLVGRCTGIELSGGSEGLAAMKLTMECPTGDIEAISQYIRRNL